MNEVRLQEGHPVDENLRPIKVGGKSTALEVAQHGNGARVNGDLEVTGDIKGNIKEYIDTGDNTQYHFIKVGFYSTSTARIYLPIPGAEDMREITSPIYASERLSFICPFDGSLETVWARSEYTPGNTRISLYVATTAVEIPSAAAIQTVIVDMSVDDTSYEFDFVSAGTNTFSQGDIIMFTVDPTTQLGDCHFMIVLKFDIST